MRLNLGSSDDLKVGWTNVDIVAPPNANESFQDVDLNDPWPWTESSIDAIMAHDVFEHLSTLRVLPKLGCDWWDDNPGVRKLMRECSRDGWWLCEMSPQVWALNESWRVLKPGGKLDIKVPAVALSDGSVNPGASCDPTHRNFWHEDIRYYFCDQWADKKTGERGRLGPGMGIVGMFKLIHCSTDDYGAGRERRSKLSLILEAVK